MPSPLQNRHWTHCHASAYLRLTVGQRKPGYFSRLRTPLCVTRVLNPRRRSGTMSCMTERSTIQPVWRAWLCFFVWRPGGAGEVLRLDLLDVELRRALAHGLQHIFERR